MDFRICREYTNNRDRGDMNMRTTKQGDVILSLPEVKVLLDYLNKQKAKINEDMPYTIDNIRVVLMLSQADKNDYNYSI